MVSSPRKTSKELTPVVGEQPPGNRAITGQFQKGQSGNPNGRPKDTEGVRELARSYAAEAIETLVTIMRDEQVPPAARAMAANSLLDRGVGKPHQTIDAELTGKDGQPLTPTIILTGRSESAPAPKAVGRVRKPRN